MSDLYSYAQFTIDTLLTENNAIKNRLQERDVEIHAMHAELSRLNELMRWKSCTGEPPEKDGEYLVRSLIYFDNSVRKVKYSSGTWTMPALHMQQGYEWREIE